MYSYLIYLGFLTAFAFFKMRRFEFQIILRVPFINSCDKSKSRLILKKKNNLLNFNKFYYYFYKRRSKIIPKIFIEYFQKNVMWINL